MQYPNTFGALFITPNHAHLTHNTDFFTKMDPFIIFFSPSGQKVQTQVCYGGGKKPHWNEQVELSVQTTDRITIEIWDHHTFTSNESVAVGHLNVSKVLSMGGSFKDHIPLFWKGAPAGELTLSCNFVPTSTNMGINVGPTYFPQQQVTETINIREGMTNYGGYPQPQMQETVTIREGMGNYGGYPQPQVTEKVTIREGMGNYGGYLQPQTQETVTIRENYGGYYQPQMTETVTVTENMYGGGFPQQMQVYQNQAPGFVVEEVIIQKPHHGHHHHHR